jgi:hypothetical protein
MRCCRFFLALVLPVTIALPAPAGILFGRHKHKPAERVPELIVAVKTEADEGKRESAAKELREYDTAAFPDIVPVLVDVLQHDAKAGVRAEAAQTLGKLRPVSQDVGWALEEAIKDPSVRVRWQARSALLGYRIAGYRSEPAVTEKPMTTTGRNPTSAPVTKRVIIPPMPRTDPVVTSGETAPPPLAQPLSKTSAARPLPNGPAQPGLAPSETPNLQRLPAQSSDQGPDLSPQ